MHILLVENDHKAARLLARAVKPSINDDGNGHGCDE